MVDEKRMRRRWERRAAGFGRVFIWIIVVRIPRWSATRCIFVPPSPHENPGLSPSPCALRVSLQIIQNKTQLQPRDDLEVCDDIGRKPV